MIVKDLMYPEKYTQNGEEKTKWINCGAVFIKDDGKMSLKLSAVPVNCDGQFQIFDKKPREGQQPQQPQQQYKPRPEIVHESIPTESLPF